jgi:lysophospholipase L1-like esterase
VKGKKENSTAARKATTKLGLFLLLPGIILGVALLMTNDGFKNQIGPLEISGYSFAFLLVCLGVTTFIFKDSNFLQSKQRVINKWVLLIEGPLLTGISLMIILLVLELGLRLYAQANPVKRLYWYTMNVNTGDYSTLIENPVYQGAEYAVPAFFDESLDPQNHTITNDPEFGFIVPQNYRGDFINVINHRRNTVGQPEGFRNTIYLFGGSTIFNIAVPDQYTVASQLQQLINQSFPDLYRVENLGVIGVTTDQQLFRLKSLELQPGDVVIFYDGFNDILDNMDRDIGPLIHVLMKFQFFNVFIKPVFPQIIAPYHISDPNDLTTTFETNLLAAQLVTEKQDGYFVHFLQPSLFLVDHPSEHEKELLETINRFSPGWAQGFIDGYPLLAEVNQSFRETDSAFYDLREIFCHEYQQDDQEIFLDDIHVNHIGNQWIAEAIFVHLIETLPEN